LDDLLSHPVTTFTTVLLSCIYLYTFSRDLSPFVSSYSLILSSHHHHRFLTSTLAHGSILHIVFNLSTLHSVRTLEDVLTPQVYLSYTIISIILCTLLHLLLTHLHVALKSGTLRPSSYVSTTCQGLQAHVGYSGVIFSLLTYQILLQPSVAPIFFLPSLTFETHTLPYLDLKYNLAPLIMCVFTSVIIKNASFVGHLAGVVAGYLIHALSTSEIGLERFNFDLLDWYLWCVLAALLSDKFDPTSKSNSSSSESKFNPSLLCKSLLILTFFLTLLTLSPTIGEC